MNSLIDQALLRGNFMIRKLKKLLNFMCLLFSKPNTVINRALGLEVTNEDEAIMQRAVEFADQYLEKGANLENIYDQSPGSLKTYFCSIDEGPGVWKWLHYFPVFERHFSRFRGKQLNVLEIGVYSGGSLRMWRDYFGPDCKVFGVDIEEKCKAYENEYTQILIGDQADRNFWRSVLKELPPLDIVIDDGGHHFQQQVVSLEELLPYIRPGGVYLCEDIHGESNKFSAYVHMLSNQLNAMKGLDKPAELNGGHSVNCTEFQSHMESIHYYPFVTVLEKRVSRLGKLESMKRGTEWAPD
ncbi:MAG: SAM-dependent methyltransferase [Planctomycetota bacterium]